MTHRYTIGGIAFLVDKELRGLPTTGFTDATLRVRFVDDQEITSGHNPELRVVTGPFDLRGAIDPSAREVVLPNLSPVPAERAWQLRQMAPIFSAVLGRLVLHAGAVEADGRVIAFIGESGAGKSTLARFLANRGYALVADDLLTIRFDPEPLAPINGRPLPLGMVMFMHRTTTDTVIADRLVSVDALQSLVRNGFGEHGDPQSWAFQFDAYHRISTSTPIVDLTIPDDLASLPLVEQAISDLVDTLPRPGAAS